MLSFLLLLFVVVFYALSLTACLVCFVCLLGCLLICLFLSLLHLIHVSNIWIYVTSRFHLAGPLLSARLSCMTRMLILDIANFKTRSFQNLPCFLGDS